MFEFLCYSPSYDATLTAHQRQAYYVQVATCQKRLKETSPRVQHQSCPYNRQYRATLSAEHARVYDIIFLKCERERLENERREVERLRQQDRLFQPK